MEGTLHARERVIRQRFATLTCPRCQQFQHQAGVLVLARRHDTWLVLVTCAHCDHRGIYIAAFPPPASAGSAPSWSDDPLALDVRPLSPAALAAGLFPAIPRETPAVTLDDVHAMRAFLGSFDGDFQRLFADS